MTLVLGVDIGGTKIAAGLVTEGHRVLARASIATPATEGAEAIIGAVESLAGELCRTDIGREWPIVGCGVGAAGVIDPETGSVVSATSSLADWAGTHLKERLAERLALPTAVLNDVHAHALGESRAGAGRGVDSLLLIAAGTGIGGALVLRGEVQLGRHGVSGHFGHAPSPEAAGRVCTCGRIGHLEVVASGPAIAQAYSEAWGASVELKRSGESGASAEPGASGESGASCPFTSHAVFARAEAGDAVADSVIQTAAFALGRSIGGLINSLDPERVVVGGGLAGTGRRWWDALHAGVRSETLPLLTPTAVLPATLGADAAVIGAAAHYRSTIDASLERLSS